MHPILERLAAGERSLPSVTPRCPAEEIALWVEGRPFAGLVRCDALARVWIATRAWPTLAAGDDDDDVAELHLRLAAAKDLFGDPQARALAGDTPPDEVLEDLLVSFWREQGIAWAHHAFD